MEGKRRKTADVVDENVKEDEAKFSMQQTHAQNIKVSVGRRVKWDIKLQ